ncbi:MAG: ribosome maturation factor RimM [Candidatus Limivicinus sp.]|nr:ribosome maturation factor RimM [Clostridiales bacterium]MDY6131750.1 ribosome maturation factor RimM [Candidatus Limivicinus sp.]
MEKKQYIEAGRIVNTHGVAGEVKIEVWLDSPQFLKSFKRCFIDRREVKLLSARVHKGFLIVKLEGVEDVNAAMALKGRTVFIDRADARLPKGAFFLQDIIGASVVDESGSQIGKLVDVMETPASNVYVVKGEREHLIPAVPEFILSTDADNGIITVHLIEGM